MRKHLKEKIYTVIHVTLISKRFGEATTLHRVPGEWAALLFPPGGDGSVVSGSVALAQNELK